MANKTIALTSASYSGTTEMKLYLTNPTTGAIGNNASGDTLTEVSNGLFTTIVDEAITGWWKVTVKSSTDIVLLEDGNLLIEADIEGIYQVDDPTTVAKITSDQIQSDLSDELDIINNIPDSFDAISTQIDGISTVVYVSPAAFTSPGKITGRTLRPYYKDTSRLGPIGIADSTKTPIDLSDFDGDLYVSVMDADTLEVLLYDDDPYFVTSNLYIDPSPESVGVLNAPLCWALRRISNNQTLMEGPWEVQFAAYRTT